MGGVWPLLWYAKFFYQKWAVCCEWTGEEWEMGHHSDTAFVVSSIEATHLQREQPRKDCPCGCADIWCGVVGCWRKRPQLDESDRYSFPSEAVNTCLRSAVVQTQVQSTDIRSVPEIHDTHEPTPSRTTLCKPCAQNAVKKLKALPTPA